MQLPYVGLLVQFCTIHLFFNSVGGVAIRGDNVRDATKHEFPFAVAISKVINSVAEALSSSDPEFCTGSLITRKHVLTAEHCLLKKQLEDVEILAGSNHLDFCKAYEPETWVTYQEWKYNDSEKYPPCIHDIAVITLKNCVDNANVKPAIIAKFEPQDLFGTTVKLAGWGWTSGKFKPRILRTINAKVLTNTECDSRINRLVELNVSTPLWRICTSSDPWASAAWGDSGGPLLDEQNELIGVISSACPNDALMLKTYSRQDIDANRLLEKRVNVHASLHYYEDFMAHFANSDEARSCQ